MKETKNKGKKELKRKQNDICKKERKKTIQRNAKIEVKLKEVFKNK